MDKKVKVDISVIEQTKVDPVTFEVLRSIFEYASDRMSTVLQRASFSPILADMVDFSMRSTTTKPNCSVRRRIVRSIWRQ